MIRTNLNSLKAIQAHQIEERVGLTQVGSAWAETIISSG